MATKTSPRRAAAKKIVVKPTKKGQKKIVVAKGGLHRSTGTPAGKKIPASKRAAARAGKYGPKAKQQELMAENVFKR